MNWIALESLEQFEELLQSEEPIIVYKHSTRCSLSTMVKSRLERDWDIDTPIYFLDLIARRPLSNSVESISGIRHESPQIIIFKGGQPTYNSSHTAINVSRIKEYLA